MWRESCKEINQLILIKLKLKFIAFYQPLSDRGFNSYIHCFKKMQRLAPVKMLNTNQFKLASSFVLYSFFPLCVTNIFVSEEL